MSAHLLPWMEGVGIWYDASLLRVAGAEPGTMSILARRAVVSGALLARIPKSSCLTKNTTKIAGILAAEGFSGGLGLVIAVWYERGLGEGSVWAGYFRSMRSREALPIFWGEEALGGLAGTEVSLEGIASDRRDVEEDYREHVLGLVGSYPGVFGEMSEAGRGLEAFREAASLVASRAFGVDGEHGDGMVPLADVFNHKVSRVQLNEAWGVHGEEEEEEEEEEDEEDEEDDEDDEDEEDEEGGEEDDCGRRGNGKRRRQDVPSPSRPSRLPDVMPSAGAEAPELCGMKEANGLDLRLQIAIIDDEVHDCLQIVAASDVAAGKEVWNTYGELSNDVLLKKYGACRHAVRSTPLTLTPLTLTRSRSGFCVPENPFGFVTLDKMGMIARLGGADPASQRDGQVRARQPSSIPPELLDSILSETSLLDEDDEPFLVHANGHVNLALFAILRMVIDGAVDLESPLIVEAMEAGVPVAVDVALQTETREDAEARRRRAQCVEALSWACEARRRMLEESAGARGAARVLRMSELGLLDDFGSRLKSC